MDIEFLQMDYLLYIKEMLLMNSKDIIELEKNNIMQSYAKFDLVIEKGEGSKVYDVEGKEYIDMTSGIGVSSLGYGNKELVNALTEQISKLLHISNLYYNTNASVLAEKIVNVSGMSKVFFGNSGAEANEGAIKIARKYSNDKYGNNRNKILTLKKSFHGRTVTTLVATGQDKFHKYFDPFTPGFDYVEANNIEDFKAHLDENVCAIMLEAIQGEGGVNPLNADFVKEVCNIANKKDILVIFDEVQCGIGRTGKMFGYENFNVKPDIITLAKGLGAGLPIGAVVCNEKLSAVLGKGDHGSTFGGNPLVCRAGVTVLNEVTKEGFLEEVAKKGEYLTQKLEELSLKLGNGKVVAIRGLGLMKGIEMNFEVKDVIQKCIQKGVLFLSAGPNVIRMLPPLVITYEEIDKAIGILSGALSE
jgi:acetylornithine/N-succinyldiaminopimelate aminotransferase